MPNKIIILLTLIFASLLITSYAEEEHPMPPSSHPRLYINKDVLPIIKERVNKPEYQAVYKLLLEDSERQTDGVLITPAVASVSNYNDTVLRYAESNAFRYLTTGNEDFANRAKNCMINYFNTYVTSNNTEMQMRESGDIAYIGAIVYDWCYDALSESDKQILMSGMMTCLSRLHIGYPPINQGAVVGHGSEAQLLREMLAVGVAIYNEDPSVYNSSIGRFMKEFVPARKFAFQAGFYHQGTSYGSFRGGMEYMAVELFDRMGYPDIFGEDMKNMLYQFIYSRRPDGQFVSDGDMFEQVFGSRTVFQKLALHAASYHKDPYYMREFLDQLSSEKWKGKGWDSVYISPTEFMMFYDSDVKAKAFTELALTKYFPGPTGAMIARTGWGIGKNSSTVVCEFKIGEYQFFNHAHSDAGQFQIYYKGGLATDTGVYQGTNGGYGSQHDMNYNKRTIAHNTVLIYDPKEVIGSTTINDGGQRMPKNRGEPPTIDFMFENEYKMSEVLANDFGPDLVTPDYSYLKGDLSLAYSKTKLENFKRSFVFLNLKDENYPACLIVYDKVTSTSDTFKKYWLLHSYKEPEISGNTSVIRRSDNGYNGKLINETLLPKPENTKLEVVHGFDVFGTVFDNAPKSGADRSEAGDSYRIQVSNKNNVKTENFLNVMQVMDNNSTLPSQKVSLIDKDNVVGAVVGDRVALFNKEGSKFTDKVTFSIDGDKKGYKILVTDLVEGFWLIEKDNSSITLGQTEVLSDKGTLYFKGDAGNYTLTKYNERIAPKPFPIKITSIYEEDKINIEFDGKIQTLNNYPVLLNDVLMVPMKEVFALLGKNVTYDEKVNTITGVIDESEQIVLDVGRKTGLLNGSMIKLDYATKLIDNDVYIPLSLLNTMFKLKTTWSPYFKELSLTVIPSTLYDIATKPKNPLAIPIQKMEASGFQEGSEPVKALDNNLATRWSVEGDDEWGIFDLGADYQLTGVGAAWHQGTIRTTSFDILLSKDGKSFVKVFSGNSSGSSNDIEEITFEKTEARYVKTVVHGNSVNKWNSLTEFEVYGEK